MAASRDAEDIELSSASSDSDNRQVSKLYKSNFIITPVYGIKMSK